jgi:hypothetical protein
MVNKGGIQVRRWMWDNRDGCRDPQSGEINAEPLAEQACELVSAKENGAVPARFYEWAYAIARRDRHVRRGTMPSGLGGFVQSFDNWLRD